MEGMNENLKNCRKCAKPFYLRLTYNRLSLKNNLNANGLLRSFMVLTLQFFHNGNIGRCKVIFGKLL